MEDWGAVRTNDEMMHWLFQRDTHAVEVIQREVLAKRRRALVIYGGLHFLRNPSQPEAPGIVVRLERAGREGLQLLDEYVR